ncbi:GNAT family N-acetyltransferase [Candidatus Dojkabacteria bacterium]|nr:GNAT family N-acetyltransferase [Candidatus Dojkabacteria bacterium]
MITFETITFSKDKDTKISEIESQLIPIYLSVWDWNFIPKTYEDRIHYTKELIKADKALIIKEDGKSVGYIAFKTYKDDSLVYLYVIEIDVLKEYRGKGYSKILFEKLLETVQIDILYGEIQNPISTKSINSVMRKHGYYTYWVEEPVDTSYPTNNLVKRLSRKVVEIFDPANLGTYRDGIKEFTMYSDEPEDRLNVVPELEHIFKKVKVASEKYYKSAFGVLISVKKEIIN